VTCYRSIYAFYGSPQSRDSEIQHTRPRVFSNQTANDSPPNSTSEDACAECGCARLPSAVPRFSRVVPFAVSSLNNWPSGAIDDHMSIVPIAIGKVWKGLINSRKKMSTKILQVDHGMETRAEKHLYESQYAHS
jgi:hypothetical protein